MVQIELFQLAHISRIKIQSLHLTLFLRLHAFTIGYAVEKEIILIFNEEARQQMT